MEQPQIHRWAYGSKNPSFRAEEVVSAGLTSQATPRMEQSQAPV